MRRLLVILSICIVVPIAVLWGYLAWDNNPNKIAPAITAKSYNSIFEEYVKYKKGGKSYSQLTDDEKINLIKTILNTTISLSEPSDIVKEVALFKLKDLPNKSAALSVLKSSINGLNTTLYEVCVNSISNIETPEAKKFLDSLWYALYKDASTFTPLAGYTQSVAVVSEKDNSLNLNFNELQRKNIDYSNDKVNEMALLFPNNPEYFIAIPNFDDVLSRFKKSKFVSNISGTPASQDVWEYPVLRSVKALQERINKSLSPVSSLFELEELFRDNLMIAEYKNDFLLATYKDKNLSFAETALKAYQTLSKVITINKTKIVDVEINEIKAAKADKSLVFATVGDYFVVGTNYNLVANSIQTYKNKNENSLAINPHFNSTYSKLDFTGTHDVLYAWLNPTKYFDVIGNKTNSAAKFHILARTLGRVTDFISGNDVAVKGRQTASIGIRASSAKDFWQYITGTRTLSKRYIDSMNRLTGVNFQEVIIPNLTSNYKILYKGLEYLQWKYSYDEINTAYNLVFITPINPSAPKSFSENLAKFFEGITSLKLNDTLINNAQIWLQDEVKSDRDENKLDSINYNKKLKLCFAIKEKLLVVASNKSNLIEALETVTPEVTKSPENYFSGNISMKDFSKNYFEFTRSHLVARNRYTRNEIKEHFEPLNKAFSIFNNLDFNFKNNNGLKTGTATLTYD